jgi:hypothetical protein
MWRIGWAPNNASKWQMGFNLEFKGLIDVAAIAFWNILCQNQSQQLDDSSSGTFSIHSVTVRHLTDAWNIVHLLTSVPERFLWMPEMKQVSKLTNPTNLWLLHLDGVNMTQHKTIYADGLLNVSAQSHDDVTEELYVCLNHNLRCHVPNDSFFPSIHWLFHRSHTSHF